MMQPDERPTPSLTYRTATRADLGLLADWNHQLIRDEGHPNAMTVPELAERVRGWLAGEYTAAVFCLDGELVAYALHREDPGQVYLRHPFVAHDRRRRGIGREAVRLLLTKILPAGQRVRVECLTGNARGLAFWRAVGFHDHCVTLEARTAPSARSAVTR